MEKRTHTHQVADKNAMFPEFVHNPQFVGTQKECEDWIAQHEHPEWWKVMLSKSEYYRQDMCRTLFGEPEPILSEREESALAAAMKMKADYSKRLDKSAESAVLHLENFLNNFSCPMSEFIELMTRRHRTLQQSFTKLCFKWIEKAASDDYNTDGRNEASHKTSKRVMDNWLLKHPDDSRHIDREMLKQYPPSTFLPMV